MNGAYKTLLTCMFAVCATMNFSGCDGGGGGSFDFGEDKDSNVVACLGDSITADVNYPGVPPYPSALAGMVGEKTVVNEGRGGELSSSGRSRIGGVLEKHKPGFICILYGANDVILGVSKEKIADNIRAMAQAALDAGTKPIIATMTPMTGSRGAAFNGGVLAANILIRNVASELGVALADLELEFSGSAAELLPDGLHPNADGTVIIAMAFADHI